MSPNLSFDEKYEKTLSDSNIVISDSKPGASNYATRAAIHLTLGEQELSQQDIKKALLLEGMEPEDHYRHALALVLDKHFKEAIAELELALTDTAYQRLLFIDDRLDPIRGLPEFQALVAKYQ